MCLKSKRSRCLFNAKLYPVSFMGQDVGVREVFWLTGIISDHEALQRLGDGGKGRREGGREGQEGGERGREGGREGREGGKGREGGREHFLHILFCVGSIIS